MNGEAYNSANNDCANYSGCTNKRGSNDLGYNVFCHVNVIIQENMRHSELTLNKYSERKILRIICYFQVTLGDLGDIYKIRVGRKDHDEWEGWHLDEVKLQDKDTEKEYIFVFDRWMDRKQDDYDIVRELAAEVDGKPCLPSEISRDYNLYFHGYQ